MKRSNPIDFTMINDDSKFESRILNGWPSAQIKFYFHPNFFSPHLPPCKKMTSSESKKEFSLLFTFHGTRF